MGLGKTYSADYLIDSNGNTGVSGQVLISTATGIDWADGSAITGGPYLPLSAGSSYPLTDALSFSITLDTSFPSASIKHNSNGYVYFSGGANGALFGNSTQQVRLQVNSTNMEFLTGGTTKAIITADGNVGIGTTSPTATLNVKNSSAIALPATSGTTQSASALRVDNGNVVLDFGSYSSNGASWIQSSLVSNLATTFPISLNPNGGNVGIGTTAPGAKLEVAGDLKVSLGAIIGNVNTASSTTNYESTLRVKGKNNYSDGTTWYGDYGQIILHSTSNMTDSARRFMITNALDNNKFAIVRSADATTDPSVNATATGVNSGTADFVIDNSGNVGIGTTSPVTKLHVHNGEATVASATDGVKLSYSNGNSSGIIDTAFSDNNLEFRTNGTAKMWIANGGNVGIGTTDPNEKLTIVGDGTKAKIELLVTGNTGESQIHFGDDDDVNSGRIAYNHTSDYMSFYTNNVGDRMIINSSGNVGIGTTDPQKNLTIASAQGDGIQFNYDATSNYRHQILNYWNSNADSRMDFNIARTSGQAPETIMSVGYGGNVGIGTTAPDRRLVLDGTLGTAALEIKKNTDRIVYLGTGSSASADDNTILHLMDQNVVKINLNTVGDSYLNGGNVGIGTTGPQDKLHVVGTIRGDLKLEGGYTSGTTDVGKLTFGYTPRGGDTNNKNIAYITAFNTTTDSTSGGYLTIGTRATNGSTGEHIRVTAGGNVGIGTTSPQVKLHVEGRIRSTYDGNTAWYSGNYVRLFNSQSFGFLNSSGSSIAQINLNGNSYFNGGNVGIGTTSPGSYDTAKIGSSHRFLNVEAPTGNYAVNTLAGGLGGNGDRIGFLTFANVTNSATYKYSAWIGAEVEGATENKAGGRLVFSTTSDNSTAGPIERMRIDSAGAIKFNAYGAGFLQTDANGNITAGTVTTSDTLDDVTDNGNSTTNSIVLGASTTDGTMLVRGSYSSGNIVVIGGMKSSGGAMIGYAVKPDTANNHSFVSSSAFTLERSAYYQQGNRHRWYAGASQDAAIGNAVSISETMRLDFDKLGLSTSSPASLIHLGKPTNGTNIITFGEASIGGPHGLDFYGDDATRTLKYSIYYRTGTENISMETSNGKKRFEINQNGGVTFNEAFTFPTADGSTGAALVTNGSGALSWGGGYKQYSPVGWQVLNNQTKTANAQNISSNSSQVLNGTTPVQRNSATEFQATQQGWYEIQYSFIIKNNYSNRANVGAYMGYSHGSGGGVISGSHSTDYVRYNTYGEYAQIQNTYYFYAPDTVTKFYLYSYLLSGSMNMTTQSVAQSMISFRYINNDIT